MDELIELVMIELDESLFAAVDYTYDWQQDQFPVIDATSAINTSMVIDDEPVMTPDDPVEPSGPEGYDYIEVVGVAGEYDEFVFDMTDHRTDIDIHGYDAGLDTITINGADGQTITFDESNAYIGDNVAIHTFEGFLQQSDVHLG